MVGTAFRQVSVLYNDRST